MLSGAILALDVGATNVRAAVVGPDGTIDVRRTARTPTGQAGDAVVSFILDLLRQARDEYAASGGRDAIAVGICAPGPLDAATGTLIEPPNLGGDWRGLALGPAIGDGLRLPWALDRDTVGTILGEWHFGAGRGSTDLVYLTISTGVGGAVVTDGRLLLGPDGVAGELGHMTVDMDGPLCGCGAPGHVEAFASGVAIARAGRSAVRAGSAGEPLKAMAESAGVDRITAEDVSRAADLGDRAAGVILAGARRAVAFAVVSLVNVFAPDVVMLGGGITRAWGEHLLAPTRSAVAEQAFRIQADRVRVIAAALGDDGGLAGAVPLVAARLPHLDTRERPTT